MFELFAKTVTINKIAEIFYIDIKIKGFFGLNWAILLFITLLLMLIIILLGILLLDVMKIQIF